MEVIINQEKNNWYQKQQLKPLAYRCGFCGNQVSSITGYKVGNNPNGSGEQVAAIYICPNCCGPTFNDLNGNQIPDVPFGSSINNVPENLNTLYQEARRCTSNNAYTASILLCRKILMHIGVEEGAEKGKNFIHYVEYLSDKGYLPPNGKHWVEHIRKKGNEANHEIVIMKREDAQDLMIFIEMLLRFIYEFPNRIPSSEPNKEKIT
jgi:hypothetical protein